MESEANANELIGTFRRARRELGASHKPALTSSTRSSIVFLRLLAAAARPAPTRLLPSARSSPLRVFSSETEDQQPSTAVGTAAVTSVLPAMSTDAPLHWWARCAGSRDVPDQQQRPTESGGAELC